MLDASSAFQHDVPLHKGSIHIGFFILLLIPSLFLYLVTYTLAWMLKPLRHAASKDSIVGVNLFHDAVRIVWHNSRSSCSWWQLILAKLLRLFGFKNRTTQCLINSNAHTANSSCYHAPRKKSSSTTRVHSSSEKMTKSNQMSKPNRKLSTVRMMSTICQNGLS